MDAGLNRGASTLGTLLGNATPCSHAGGDPDKDVYGVGLEFEELSYSVSKTLKKDGKSVVTQVNLLHGLSGQALKGHVTAVLGPSGAGKSTFLDALAGRIAKGSLGGRVSVEGRPVTTSMLKRISSYVMQDDQLFPMLTVYETFLFAAEVRLPVSFTRKQKKERVEDLIVKLGLQSAAHTYIGNEGVRGVSGGERRRVSIGVDIIHGPSLLFLDEPTSGLDSTSAFGVVERLRDIAAQGSTVILTIHQPSFRIQQLIKRFIILARGKLIYMGKPDGMEGHLSTFGRPVPEGESGLEYLLDVIKEYDDSDLGLDPLVQFQRDGTLPDPGKTPMPKVKQDLGAWDEDDFDRSISKSKATPFNNPKLASQFYKEFPVWLYTETVETLKATPARLTPSRTPRTPAHKWKRTPARSVTSTAILDEFPIHTSYSDFTTDSSEGDDVYDGPKFENPWLREVKVLMWRNWLNVMRTPELFLSREMVILVMSVMLATIFKKPKHDLSGVTELMNFYIFGLCLLFFSSNDAVPTFIQERYIFIREASHNAYRASSYTIANLVVYLPFLAVQGLTFVLITYWALHLQGSFIIIWVILFASLITTNSFVMFISAVVPNYIMGYALVIAVTALYFLNCGYFLKRLDIPAGWRPLHYISTMKYPFEALLKNEFSKEVCYAFGPVLESPGPLGTVFTSNRTNNCSVNQVDVLKTMNMEHVTIWVEIAVLLAWGVLYRLFFYIMIRFYSKNQRI